MHNGEPDIELGLKISTGWPTTAAAVEALKKTSRVSEGASSETD